MAFTNAKNIRRGALFVLAVALSASLLTQLHVNAANTFPGINTLVNVNSSGGGGQNVSGTATVAQAAGLSSDGNIVLFSSTQPDIAGSNGTTTQLLYERNIATGTNTRVDVSASGVAGNGGAYSGVMSESGRYVVFNGSSTNLIDGTTMPAGWQYIKDMQTGGVTAVAIGSLTPVSVSNDGRFVLFSTMQTGAFISGARNGYYDLVMYDMAKNLWSLVDAPVSGSLQSVHVSVMASPMSCDGAYVVFRSSATNLVSGYSGSGDHIFLADIRNGLRITDITPGGTHGNTAAYISCNGRYILFTSGDRNLVSPTPTALVGNNNYHVIEYDRITGIASYVDSDSSGVFTATGGTSLGVADNGDALMTVPFTQSIATYSPMYLKHIGDGSGTRENIEKSAGGSYLALAMNNGLGSFISANSKAVAYSTHDAYELGLTPTDTCDTNSNTYYTCDVVHAKTGL